MNLLRRTASSSSFASSEAMPEENIQNRDEIYIRDFNESLDNWKIPRIAFNEIYQMAKWKLFAKSDYVITTEEKTIPISDGLTTIHLLDKEALIRYSKEWNYLHIGLVQIGAKPLAKLGLNNSILMVLRDSRELDYDKSIHACIETSLNTGPIQFSCHPNATIGIKDRTSWDSLVLNVKTHNYRMRPGTSPLAVIYRVYFKLMRTCFGSKAFKIDKRGQTLMLQTDLTRSNISIPRMIQWNQVELPDSWEINNPVPKPIIFNNEPTNVVQHPEGRVTIQFARRSMDLPRMNLASYTSSSRRSIDLSSTTYQEQLPAVIVPPPIPPRSTTTRVENQPPTPPSIIGTENQDGITHPIYQQDPQDPEDSEYGTLDPCPGN